MRLNQLWAALPRLARVAIALQGTLLLSTSALFLAYGLSVKWSTLLPHFLLLAMLAALWVFHIAVPDRRSPLIPDLLLAVLLLISLTNIASPAQYAAVAARRPLIDKWLVAGDRALGVDVPAVVAWTSNQGPLPLLLKICYYSLLPQLILAPIATVLVLRNRLRLWEYFFHFHFCGLMTIVALLFWPARCVFTELHFNSLLNQERFIRHFDGFRSGALTVVQFNDLEGLISMPSFHVAAALFVTWAFRGQRVIFPLLLLLNLGLVASTVLCGAHYFVDIPATFALFLLSLLVLKSLRGTLMPEAWRGGAINQVSRRSILELWSA